MADAPRAQLARWLQDGTAWKKFVALVEAQGGDATALERIGEIHRAPVVHEFCADLLASATRSTDCLIDSRMIARLLADVDHVTLQCLVLRLCTALINADRQVDKGESIVLLAAIDHWGLHPVGLEPLEPLPHDLDPNGCGHARCTMNILDLS